jgi:hypothetical protein
MRRIHFALALAIGLGVAFGSIAAAPDPEVETPEVLPDREGREETFYACTACHSSALIRAQGMSRDAWDRLIDFMQERHNMVPLDAADRKLVVDYLAGAFPPRRQGGFRNPFLQQ